MNEPQQSTYRTAELHVARQVLRLLRRSDRLIWQLVDFPTNRQADDVTIRDLDGTPVAYARPYER